MKDGFLSPIGKKKLWLILDRLTIDFLDLKIGFRITIDFPNLSFGEFVTRSFPWSVAMSPHKFVYTRIDFAPKLHSMKMGYDGVYHVHYHKNSSHMIFIETHAFNKVIPYHGC